MNAEKLEETLAILKEMNLDYVSNEGSCKIIVKNNYGYCSVSLNNLRKRSYPTIQSSLDKSSKTSFFIFDIYFFQRIVCLSERMP